MPAFYANRNSNDYFFVWCDRLLQLPAALLADVFNSRSNGKDAMRRQTVLTRFAKGEGRIHLAKQENGLVKSASKEERSTAPAPWKRLSQYQSDDDSGMCEQQGCAKRENSVDPHISVVDRDEPQTGHRFYFTLAPEASNNRHFTLWDVKDSSLAPHICPTTNIQINKGGFCQCLTSAVLWSQRRQHGRHPTQRSGFNRHEQNVYLLPIQVVDSGPPSLSSTGTLTIHVCGCDPVLVLLILTLKRHRKGQRMTEDEEDMRDNVIKYNDEGGGEQDTQAYDMTKSSEAGPDIRSLPQWIQTNRHNGATLRPAAEASLGVEAVAADFSLFKGYIKKKVEQADADLSVPPYDSFQTYAFEGTSSPALSLSSIHTLSTTSEQDFSYLSDWGPRFRQLAGYYAPGNLEEEGS
ncbi:hypothetical protein WMY93_011950 [Mugilogobius chulae]|uniref:Cadherin domain-containing protein n=1 Tax=Mugilogobius chulae TaxID=88201 RepID=A0AAW0P7T2_9GOBI